MGLYLLPKITIPPEKNVKKPIRILLIEDDQDDVDLLKEALDDNGVQHIMEVVKDGGQVADHMKTSTDQPDVIVLDYNLPRVHGRELLKRIKLTEHFQSIPVVILTTSSAEADISYAYREGASKYLIKPTTIQGLNDVVACIVQLTA